MMLLTDCDLGHFGSLPIDSTVSNGGRDVSELLERSFVDPGTRIFGEFGIGCGLSASSGKVGGVGRANFSHVAYHVDSNDAAALSGLAFW